MVIFSHRCICEDETSNVYLREVFSNQITDIMFNLNILFNIPHLEVNFLC